MTTEELKLAESNAKITEMYHGVPYQMIPYSTVEALCAAVDTIREQEDARRYFPLYARVGCNTYLFTK